MKVLRITVLLFVCLCWVTKTLCIAFGVDGSFHFHFDYSNVRLLLLLFSFSFMLKFSQDQRSLINMHRQTFTLFLPPFLFAFFAYDYSHVHFVFYAQFIDYMRLFSCICFTHFYIFSILQQDSKHVDTLKLSYLAWISCYWYETTIIAH